MCVCVCICMYICIYMYIYIYVYIYIYINCFSVGMNVRGILQALPSFEVSYFDNSLKSLQDIAHLRFDVEVNSRIPISALE